MSVRTVQLGEVATIERRAATEVECSNLPFVGLEHVESGSGNFAVEFKRRPEPMLATKFRFGAGHVLYGKLRPYLNKVVLPDFDGVCTTEILPILPKSSAIDRRFLYALLLSPYFVRWASIRVSGANLPRLDPGMLEEFCFDLPSLPEQERIASLLAQADWLRRTRRYAIELSDTFLPGAFLELFGDPASNPHGFPRVQVDELFAKGRDGTKCGPFGSALKKHEYQSHGIPVWTMDNFSEGNFREEGCLYVSEEKYRELAAYSTKDGDILISRAGTVGRMAIVKTKHERSIIHTNLIRLSLDAKCLSPIFFITLMKSFGSRIARLKRGQEDAYSFMSTGSLGELRIPLPPMALQQRFGDLWVRYERLRTRHAEALRQADHMFQSLLHRAFSENGGCSI